MRLHALEGAAHRPATGAEPEVRDGVAEWAREAC